jgi:hypothetical protein
LTHTWLFLYTWQNFKLFTMDQLLVMLGAYLFVILAIGVFLIVCQWKIYTKAGKPGWACLIPIYNIVVLLEIVKKPVWWLVLLLIPIANLVIAILIMIELAKVFGKDGGFTVGLILLPYVFYPILAFGDAKYIGDDTLDPASNS